MSLTKYAVKRILTGVPTLFGLSLLLFAITRLVPGDPVRLALGPQASEEQVVALRQELGLDDPLYVQYIDWLIGIFQGDWGQSLRTDQNVYADIAGRLPATLELVTVAIFLAVILAVPFGVLAARHKDHWQDHASRLGSLVGVSVPRFWLGIVLQVVLVVLLGLLPLSGRLTGTHPPTVTGFLLVDSLLARQLNTFVDAARHLILPAVTLSVATLAQVMRLVRSEMIEESRKDYILAARAFGLPSNLITFKYMLRNAFSSSLTVIGLAFGVLLGGAFVVEIVFAWPGMASYGVRSIIFQDFNAVMAVVMIIGVAYLIINFIIDLLYGVLDPRITLEEG
jgi:peptide/nickel transport system permease protein